ncbi:tetratricopeptide repeat protein [candidate division TA06 bacterium]|nr:tetratricopeptide repeat protein [candidate division TA06 bacterium]
MILVLTALALLVLAVFSPCISNGFINLDDNSYIVENSLIRNISPANIKSWFSSGYEGNYYPLVLLAYALEYKVNGPDPKVYHITGIILHLLNVFLVFALFFLLLKNGWTAGIITALWAVHPLRVESVAWAASQKDLVYTCFALLSLVTYLRYKNQGSLRDYAASLSLFLLACFSKGMAVALVPVLFLADHFLSKPFSRRSWLEKAPYAALAIVFGVISYHVQGQSQFIQTSRPLTANLLTAGYGFVFYIIKLTAPFRLSAFHPYPGTPLPWTFYLASIASVLTVIALLIWGRRNKTVFFGGMFYLVTILPVLQIVPVGGFAAAERYSYFASLGLVFIAGSYLYKMFRGVSRQVMAAAVILLVLITTAEGLAAYQRCFVWRNSLTLWSDAINKYPGANSFAHNHRGNAYDLQGRNDQAVDDFTKAVNIDPRNFAAWYNRSCVYLKLNRPDEAIEDCSRAIVLDPAYAKAYSSRGLAYGMKKQYDSSLSDLSRAITLSPKDPLFYYDRATTYGQMKNYLLAIADFSRAIELDPGYGQAYYYRGYTYYMTGDRRQAEQDVQRAKSLGFIK